MLNKEVICDNILYRIRGIFMNEKINLTNANGTLASVDIICFFEDTTTKNRYLYYTQNEVVGTGANSTVRIYVSKIRQNNPVLDVAITDQEWNVLKDHMAEALKGTANSTVKYLPISELQEPVSISDRAIGMPTSYDYINKHRGIYAQSIATLEPEPASTVQPEVQNAPVEPIPVETPSNIPTPEAPIVSEPIKSEEPVTVSEPMTEEKTEGVTASDTVSISNPIDIEEIEKKYAEMFDLLNDLKRREIEALERLNATKELNAMHNAQHADYVANEQSKEIPVSEPVPVPEPTPVTPIVPEQTVSQPVNSTDIETNWFDMPAA